MTAATARNGGPTGNRAAGARATAARTRTRGTAARPVGLVTDGEFDFDPVPRRRPATQPDPGTRSANRSPAPHGRSTGRPASARGRAAGQSPTDRRADPYETRGTAALRPERAVAPDGPRRAGLRVAPPVPVVPARTPFVVLVLTVVAAGIVGLVLLNTQINEDAFTLQHLRDQQATQDAREQQLSHELATKEAPGALAAAARRLGLVYATSPKVVAVPSGAPSTAPGAGSTAAGTGR